MLLTNIHTNAAKNITSFAKQVMKINEQEHQHIIADQTC